MNISANLSSIQAHQKFMNTNANNIANVNSDGFIPSDTRLYNSSGLVEARNTKAHDNGSQKSQTDLTKEIPNQIIIEKATALNVGAINTQDEMIGTLLDMKA